MTDVFEILQQVGDSLALAVSEDWLVQAIAVLPCSKQVSGGRGKAQGKQGRTSAAGRAAVAHGK